MNLASLLQRHLASAQKILYCEYQEDRWRDFSAREVADLAARWQQAFRDHGFERGDRVALCLKNSVHWAAIDQAALGLGLVVVPLYVNDNPENVAWCVANADARLLVLENPRMLEAPRLAGLPHIVCLQGEPAAPAASADAWLPERADEFTVADLEPDALATIVYTSGTAGRPKGVKLSHRNILSNVEGVLQVVEVSDRDVLISVLPLSHMFERTCGYYTPLSIGAKVVFSRGVNQLAEDLRIHRPTILIAVPRVFERFLARIEQTLTASYLKRQLFHLTVEQGWHCFQRRAGVAHRALRRVLRHLVARPVLEKLGGRLRLTVVGGAAVEARIVKTFIALGLNMIQGYGLTEASPVVAANREDDNDPVAVGKPLAGVEVRLNEAHELLVRGPSVMRGYWRDPEATARVLAPDGWLNTGDLADIRYGRIYIKGRSKDIMVLSNGEKFPPEEVETAILNDELFDQVMLVGEGRPYLSLLAVTGEGDEKKLVRHANARLKGFPRYVRVRRVIVCKEPWTVDNGLLTPTLKVKRQAVYQRFLERIDKLYGVSGDPSL